MLYHYTSIQAFEGILRESPSEKGLCFWASRYDCFGDKEEYKVGIEAIKNLLPKLEERLQPDRRVAQSFDWESIKVNKMLPMPYVISLTKRNKNDYMWKEYADHGHGVVLALDEKQNISFEGISHMIMLKPCLYKGLISKEQLFKEIEAEYFYGALGLLSGPKKEFALELLQDYPQAFVNLIAMYLLGYVAPRFKEERYNPEEEIRIIYPSQRPTPEVQTMLNQLKGTSLFGVKIDDLINMIKDEKLRKRDNGDKVYYKELFLPSKVLTKVYIKDAIQESRVKAILDKRNFKNIDVEIIK